MKRRINNPKGWKITSRTKNGIEYTKSTKKSLNQIMVVDDVISKKFNRKGWNIIKNEYHPVFRYSTGQKVLEPEFITKKDALKYAKKYMRDLP